jgi:histidinol phosphatase-like PHP family hydrolase
MEKEPQIFSGEKERSTEGLEKIFKYYKGEAHAHSLNSNRSRIGGVDEGRVHRDTRLLQYAEKLGLEFVVFSEHSSNPGNPRELDEQDEICQALLREQEGVNSLNKRGHGPKAYSAVEANIFFNEDGEAVIDVPISILEKKDLVIASRHNIDSPRDPEKIKESLLLAIDNPNIDIIGHPYRNIEFYAHDFNYFKKYYREKDPQVYNLLVEMEKTEDWDKVKKIIGKNEIEKDENSEDILRELNKKFTELESEYWEAWDEILDAMEKEGKVFEINLNVFTPSKSFYKKILEEASKRLGLRFSIVFDFHNLSQAKNFKDKDLESKPLPGAKSPVQINASRKIMDLIKLLEELNISPDRIINSSENNFSEFINKDKE